MSSDNRDSQMPVDEENEGFEPSLPPPSVNPQQFGSGGGLLKSIVTSALVAFAVLALTSFLGGGFFVTKKDFTANLANVAITLDQAKADLANSKAEVNSAVQGIPGTVATYVNNAVAQSTNQWTSQLSSLSDKVTGLSSSVQSNENQVTSLSSEIDATNTAITLLKDRVSALETSLTTAQTEISTLKSDVTALKNQTVPSGSTTDTGTSGVIITTTPFQSIPVYQNIQYLYSLQITNTTNTLKRVYIQALLTPSSALPGQTTANVITANFSASGGSMTANTFTTTYSPSQSNCLMILATSNGYIQALGSGTTTVIVTLDYAANPAFMWDIGFKPIVTSY